VIAVSEHTQQRSLNRYTDEIVLREQFNGKKKAVVDALPEEDDHIEVRESHSEVGKPQREYPLQRDHCTIARYEKWGDYSHRRSTLYDEYKVITVDVDREEHPREASRIEEVFDLVGVVLDSGARGPVGHLEDMTYRAANVLHEVDSILSHETRTSGQRL
jgi:hypothetical protein